MSRRKLREWPRLIAALCTGAAVLLGIGLLIGALALGGDPTTTTMTTTTTVVRRAADTTAASALRTEQGRVSQLRRTLGTTRARLKRLERHRRHAGTSHVHAKPHHPHRR